MNETESRHIGKKVLYGLAIAACGLVIALNAAGIFGVWFAKAPLTDAAVSFFRVVENTSQVLIASNNRVDQGLSKLENASLLVADAGSQISANVEDKGLVLVLLPEEKEQEVTATAETVAATYNEVRDVLQRSLTLYQSIDSLPLVNLPGLEEDQLEQLDTSIETIRTTAQTVRAEIANFRAGVSGKVDKVTTSADALTVVVTQTREKLQALEEKWTALNQLAVSLQGKVPLMLSLLAVVISLVLGFVIYTQVLVIRMFVERWKLLV